MATLPCKFILLLVVSLFLLSTNILKAQYTYAEIGLTGLTCSQCSRSVEMSLRKKLKFVDSVEMELVKTVGRITFKPNQKVEIDKVAKAVIDAGFSLQFLKAELDFSTITLNGNCFIFEKANYQLVGNDGKAISKKKLISFLGKNYLSPKDWKTAQKSLKQTCGKANEKIYFIQLEQ